MKINKLTYKAYGKLENFEMELHPEITVVFGNNEAGKSTIFNSISTLFYGFRPASREKHPYSHWYRNEINYSGIIQNDAELFLVERRLMSMPKLSIMALASKSTRNLRNESLSFLPNVSENLYDAVFHLTADDLNRADKDSWDQIQEKLIFNYGTNYLNKTSEVMRQLEQDINALWRKDKKGNPEMNQLTSELVNLMHEKSTLEEQNNQLKLKTVLLEQINDELEICQANRHKTIEKLYDYRAKLPKKELKEKVLTLMDGLYKGRAFEELDPKSIERWNQLTESIEVLQNKKSQTEAELLALKGTLNPLDETCENLIQFKPSARKLEQTLIHLLSKEQDAHMNAQERIKREEKIESAFKYLFGDQIIFSKEVRTHLKQISVMDLMSLVQNLMEGKKNNEAIDQQLALKNQDAKVKALGFVLFGVIAAVTGIFIKPAGILTFIGFGFVGYGLARFKPSKDVVASKENLAILEEKIQSIMAPFNLPPYVYQDISLRFFTKLEALVMDLIESDRLWMKHENLLNEILEMQQEMTDVLTRHHIDISSGVVLSYQFALSQIEKCEAQKNEEEQKRLKIENVLHALDLENEALQKKLNERLELQLTFEKFGDGYFDLGFEKFMSNLEVLKRVSIFNDEIERMPYSDEALACVSQESIDSLEQKRTQLEEDEKKLLLHRSDLMNEISRLRENRSIEEVTSEILTTKESLEELEDKRDTLMILLEMIKYGDERFRLENQPDIINHVSAYMRQMTDGKYTDVMVSESFELQFLVDGELLPLSKAFSKGTIQQLFFAYRLAVIDALDPDRALPLVLDEVFVNWDAIRLKKTLDLLSEIATRRQIIFFTCHTELAEKFKGLSNAKILEVNT